MINQEIIYRVGLSPDSNMTHLSDPGSITEAAGEVHGSEALYRTSGRNHHLGADTSLYLLWDSLMVVGE